MEMDTIHQGGSRYPPVDSEQADKNDELDEFSFDDYYTRIYRCSMCSKCIDVKYGFAANIHCI